MNSGQVDNEPKEGELSLSFLKRFIGFCRSRCGPRLSATAGEKLRSRYVLMRSGTVQLEKASEKRLSIPITVR